MEPTVNAPIVEPKTGIDLLSSTNFKVSQDLSSNQANIRSIFKQDYPAYAHYGRAPEAERPPLAEVMHKDESYYRERNSETTKSFAFSSLPTPDILPDVHQKLRATNFKMDVDNSKVNSFQTMHDSYFKPKMNNDYKRVMPVSALTEAHIPQGDKEKAPQPWSDYRDRYRGHDTTIHKVEKAPSMHKGGPPTIKGDSRYTHFDTTHESTFYGKSQESVKPFPAPVGTSVPSGDPKKVFIQESTMQSSFPHISEKNEYLPYMKEDVSSKLSRTNFKQKDGLSLFNDNLSTATLSYKPTTVPVERFKPGKHRNHSDLPEGDHDSRREMERVNLTTSRFYHGNPPRGIHNTIISGANLRTKSNVWFGEPAMSKTFYDTTTDEQFQPVSVPYTYNKTKFHKKSDVPLDYYDRNFMGHTSSWTDYKNPRRARSVPNPVAVNNLRMSHILPSISGPQQHSTTHQVMFTPKQAEKYTYDSGRLQKSSVPLGTLGA